MNVTILIKIFAWKINVARLYEYAIEDHTLSILAIIVDLYIL